MRPTILSFFLLILSLSLTLKSYQAFQPYQTASVADISGQVVDANNAALSGVTVAVENKQAGLIATTTTDEEGKFRIADLPPGKYKVMVDASGGYAAYREDIGVNLSRTTSLTIPLSLFPDPISDSIVGKIKGTVTNKTNDKPIKGASITISQLGGPKKVHNGITTNSEGKYDKAGLIPDKYEVRVEAPGFRESATTETLKVRQVVEVDFKLTPQ